MNDAIHIPAAEAKRNRNRYRASDMIAALSDLFPAAFTLYHLRRKPLKVGIHGDLVARLNGALTARETSIALGCYCRSVGYLANSKAGVARIDLDGNPVGIVDEREAEHAAQRLAEIRARMEKKSATKSATVKKVPMPRPPVVIGTIVGNRARMSTTVVVKRRLARL
jgi:ProP effector